MRVKAISSNMTQVSTGDATILFSYETPVAALTDKFYRTDKKHSVTTSKHINKWLDGAKAEVKPQEFFDNLL